MQYEQYNVINQHTYWQTKAYDTEIIKQTITEETTALPLDTCKNQKKKAVHIEASVEQYSDHKCIDLKTK